MSSTARNYKSIIGIHEANEVVDGDVSGAWDDGYRLARPVYKSTDLSKAAIEYVYAYREGAIERIDDLLRDGAA